MARPPIRTLIVEDDPLVAGAYSAYIGRIRGFVVSGVAHTGAGSLWEATGGRHDLVLLDLSLPDISGLEVCRVLRSRGANPDIIAVTAARDVATVRAAVSLGVLLYLVKPFGFAAFRARLERYAAFRSHFDAAATARLSQHEVDTALAVLRSHSTPGAELPKGLSVTTLNTVVDYLGEAAAPVSADQAAGLLGLSRVTARRYLEWLAGQRMVVRTQRYGRPGRPEHLYQWRGRTRHPVGDQYDLNRDRFR
ncbi:hypothetical protein CcI49_29910 [Frankia sp. CcI49]|uniref:response regulator n=1 Tax=unclassified Frankia TaxID=2632575 RepID=UPI0006C9FE23|nr:MULTISPECIES: response regulator [unclassified Frankia]KPM53551.1 chemotaxis protein CheY [Frankia sp. R43]ONH54767.1 hypothetical protein CcI49_29910 [Frankia sp. CcI49]